MPFDNFKYNESSIPEDENEKKEFFNQLEKEFYNEIESSPKAKKYFEKFNSDSIDFFIRRYADSKVDLIKRREFYTDNYQRKEDHELHFHQMAEQMLHLILQKKLFNLQLRWRAEKVTIKEINMSYDFQFWEKHIESCPFIPPIEEKEIKVMKEYLAYDGEENNVNRLYGNTWQDYSSITEKGDDGLRRDMPEWYDFYDQRLDTGGLLYLPDLKGQKEEFYFKLNHKKHDESKIQTPPAATVEDNRPRLNGYMKDISNFSKYFESDRHFIELFKYYRFYDAMTNRDVDYWDLQDAINFLSLADRPIYIPGHLVWDKAIMTAVKSYTNTRIAEAIDFVYDNYITLKELGISREKSMSEIQKEYEEDQIVNIYRQAILHARKLNGESEDFNY